MNHPALASVAAAALVVLTAGCGITDPYTNASPRRGAASSTTTASVSASSDADPAPEQGGGIPPAAQQAQSQLAAGAAQPTPQAALQHYATIYINWTADTVATVQAQLASISLGQARAQALQAAASYKHDSTLRASGVSNSGSVIAITRSLTTPGQWVIVTSESTTGQGDYTGLPASLHLTYARLTHLPDGYVVDQWAAQT